MYMIFIQALASPYLIVLTSRDPLLTAFHLNGELKRLSLLENEFQEHYKSLVQKCESFAVDLLDQVRGLNDLEVILNYSSNEELRHQDDTNGHDLARFRVAIEYKQKKVGYILSLIHVCTHTVLYTSYITSCYIFMHSIRFVASCKLVLLLIIIAFN